MAVPIRPSQLPAAPSIAANSDMIVDTGSGVYKTTPTSIVDVGGGLTFTADLSALKSASVVTPKARFYDGSPWFWTLGNFSGSNDDVTIVKANSTALTVGAWVRDFEELSPEMYGAVAGGVTNASSAFVSMISAAVSLGKPINLRGRSYLLTSGSVNFAAGGLVIKGEGATLTFSGSGRAFVMDQGGGDGSFLEAMSVSDILIVGNASTTDGFYSRGVVRSLFRNIEVRNVTGKAFHIRHGVSNQYDSLKFSPVPGSTATHGLYVDENGAGYYTANCTFINPIMEDFAGVGCQVASGISNQFFGGTFEGCATGLIVSADSDDNTFTKVWFEANTVADAVISGNGNGFIGPKFISFGFSGPNVQITASAKGTWFANGGYIRYVNIAAGSTGTRFDGVGVDENTGGTIGFQGPGPYSRIGVRKINGTGDVVGLYDDIIGPVQSIGVTGTFTPVLTPAGGTITPNAGLTQGSYVKVGKSVFLQACINVTSVSSPTGSLSITGLPFAAGARQSGSVFVTELQSTATDPIQARIDPSATTITLTKLSAGVSTAMAADVKADSTIAVSLTYITV